MAERRGSGKSESWTTIHSVCETQHRFWLVDDTGRVLVDPKGAEENYKMDLNSDAGLFAKREPLADAYIERVCGKSSRKRRPGAPVENLLIRLETPRALA